MTEVFWYVILKWSISCHFHISLSHFTIFTHLIYCFYYRDIWNCRADQIRNENEEDLKSGKDTHTSSEMNSAFDIDMIDRYAFLLILLQAPKSMSCNLSNDGSRAINQTNWNKSVPLPTACFICTLFVSIENVLMYKTIIWYSVLISGEICPALVRNRSLLV